MSDKNPMTHIKNESDIKNIFGGQSGLLNSLKAQKDQVEDSILSLPKNDFTLTTDITIQLGKLFAIIDMMG